MKGLKILGVNLVLVFASIFAFLPNALANEAKNITRSYTATLNESIGDKFVYESVGQLNPVNETKKGLTLKSANINNKYGLYLTGTPTEEGTITFTGTTVDDDKYDVTYTVTVKVTKPKKTVTKTIDATVNKKLDDTLLYESEGQLNPVNETKKGLTLKSANINNKYGLYLTGTPTEIGTITFTGTTVDDDKYDVTYSITVNVSRPKKTVTKTYEATVGKDFENVFLYTPEGQLGKLEESKSGLTLKSDTVNGSYGLHLSGLPTAVGKINFKGTVVEADKYDIEYDITVNVSKQKKTITKTYDAVIGKELEKIFVYNAEGQLDKLEETKNGITIKSDTVEYQKGIVIEGTPTELGKIEFTGTINDGDTCEIEYNITINVKNEKEEEQSVTTIGATNNSGKKSNNKGLIIGIIIGAVVLLSAIVIAILAKSKKKNKPATTVANTETPVEPSTTGYVEVPTETVEPTMANTEIPVTPVEQPIVEPVVEPIAEPVQEPIMEQPIQEPIQPEITTPTEYPEINENKEV